MNDKRYLPSPQTAKRYGVSDRTLARWIKDPPAGFPTPIKINGRWYWEEGELESYERALAANAKKAA